MSLAINPNHVTNVMVGGKWHLVETGTLVFDAYEFVEGEFIHETGGGDGFEFQVYGTESCEKMSGLVSAIEAVIHDRYVGYVGEVSEV